MTLYFIYLIWIVACKRLDWNSDQCQILLDKFNDYINEYGKISSKLNFTVNAYFIKDQGDIYFNISYNDSDLLSNYQLYGLVQEDGKKEEETCLDQKIFKQNNQTNNSIKLANIQIQSSCSCQTKQRFYSFILKKDQLSAKLVRTTNQINFFLQGNFQIAFTSSQTGEVIKFFPFNLILTNRNQITLPENKIDLQNGCKFYDCSSYISSSIQQCKDCTCTSFFSTPEIQLNEQFVLLQKYEMLDYYGFQTEIILSNNWVHNKKLPILHIDNSIKGQVKILTKAAIAFKQLIIQVSSHLSNFTCNILENQSFCASANLTATFKPLGSEGTNQSQPYKDLQLKKCY